MARRRRRLEFCNLRSSIFNPVAELFDDRFREHVARDALIFLLRCGLVEPAVQGELEILSLADVGDGGVSHLLERALDCLALGIEHGLLQRNVDVGFHGSSSIIPASAAAFGEGKRAELSPRPERYACTQSSRRVRKKMAAPMARPAPNAM